MNPLDAFWTGIAFGLGVGVAIGGMLIIAYFMVPDDVE